MPPHVMKRAAFGGVAPAVSLAILLAAGCVHGSRELDRYRKHIKSWAYEDYPNHVEPIVQRGCATMFLPGNPCFKGLEAYGCRGCCTPGFTCAPNATSPTGRACHMAPSEQLKWSFGTGPISGGPGSAPPPCRVFHGPDQQCGGSGGFCALFEGACRQNAPWAGHCCPNGFTCQPNAGNYRLWTCQTDVTDQPALNVSLIIRYPPEPLPAGACSCRIDKDGFRVPTDCPSPWSAVAQPAPALRATSSGRLEDAAGRPGVLHGVNWFGYETGANNLDGMWAYCDDNATDSSPPCRQDGEVPPWSFPSAAIGDAGQNALQLFYWKRAMTSDMALLVHRMKLLGFNAVRIPFDFAKLDAYLNPPSGGGKTEFFTCALDPLGYIASRTVDPNLTATPPPPPPYTGMPHPPPADPSNATCGLPWTWPRLDSYQGAVWHGANISFTLCNWYLPQGSNVTVLQRLLWQTQYLVSQGMYVVLDYHPYTAEEPRVADARLFAANWGNLWRIVTELPQYSQRLKGRVFADLVNEPSRWGCRWDISCPGASGARACAPGTQLYASAVAAIRQWEPDTPVFFNGMGQTADNKPCSGGFVPGMNWGEGFITQANVVRRYNISDASPFFQMDAADSPALVIAPHTYPTSITGWGPEVDAGDNFTLRCKLNWGLKARGLDYTSDGNPIPRIALVHGELGAKDTGDNSVTNADTTVYNADDKRYFQQLGGLVSSIAAQDGVAPSWLWWAWNANSGDTKGIVGPQTTWREVQWTKVRVLMKLFGLRPWYCAGGNEAACAAIEPW